MRYQCVAIAVLATMVGCTSLDLPSGAGGGWLGGSLTPAEANSFCWLLTTNLQAKGYIVWCVDSASVKSVRFSRQGETGKVELRGSYTGLYEVQYDIWVRPAISPSHRAPAEQLMFDTLSTVLR